MARTAPSDMAATVSRSDRMSYTLENLMASNQWTKFYILGVAVLVFTVIYGLLWKYTWALELPYDEEDEGEEADQTRMINAMYSVIQVMAAGEVQDYNIERKPWHALTYLVTLLTGVIVFAILVGFVDESVQAMVTLINTG